MNTYNLNYLLQYIFVVVEELSDRLKVSQVPGYIYLWYSLNHESLNSSDRDIPAFIKHEINII